MARYNAVILIIAILNTFFFIREGVSINAGQFFILDGPDGGRADYFNIVLLSIACFLASIAIISAILFFVTNVMKLIGKMFRR